VRALCIFFTFAIFSLSESPLLDNQALATGSAGVSGFEEVDLSAEADYQRGYLDEVELHKQMAANTTAARRRSRQVKRNLT